MDDKVLANAAANGDQESFTILIEQYRAHIYTIAYKITLNQDDALDVTQNVFLKLIEKIGKFDGLGTFRAWLTTLTTNAAIDYLRSLKRREILTESETLDTYNLRNGITPNNNPRLLLNAKNQKLLVEEAMKQLSPQQRAIFALRFYEDIRPKDIAERLGLAPNQVRSQLFRAIDKIRQTLNGKLI